MSLFPREHGAYGQITFPLLTSVAVAGISASALLIALAAIAGFLAHEPLLVLVGRRGVQAREALGKRAATWLATTTVAAIAAGIGGAWSMVPGARWSLALPLLPALILVAAIPAKREKSSPGEIAVALAFSFLAVPVCLAAGVPVRTAFSVGVTFALIFVAGTLAVRVVILGVRGGGDPQAVRATRMTTLILTSVGSVLLVIAASRMWLPWITMVAAAPGLTAAGWLALFPPPAARLRTVGWTLVATSAIAAVTLAAGLAAAS
jgi:hypothetical protein